MRQRVSYEVGNFAATLLYDGLIWDIESIKIVILSIDNINLHIDFLKLLKMKVELLNNS